MNPSLPAPLDERDLVRLQALLDDLPAPLEPLDVSMLDGFLCGVLLQPQPVAGDRWLRFVADADGRAPPRGVDLAPLHALVLRRHAELAAAISRRQWFDPWVYELEPDPDAGTADEDDVEASTAREAALPWVAGFALAMEHFPALMALPSPALLEPLALLYQHLGTDDLEDADELIEWIESLAPPTDLAEAVEQLVRATLLLADAAQGASASGRSGGRRPEAPRGVYPQTAGDARKAVPAHGAGRRKGR